MMINTTMRQETCPKCLSYMDPCLESRTPMEGAEKRTVDLAPWQPLRQFDRYQEDMMFVRKFGWYPNQWQTLGDDDILNVCRRTAWTVMDDSKGQ